MPPRGRGRGGGGGGAGAGGAAGGGGGGGPAGRGGPPGGGRGGPPGGGRGGPPGGGRGAGRGGGGPPPSGGAATQGRGRGTPRGGPPAAAGPIPAGAATIPGAHIETIGVRRPNVGRAGRQIQVYTNHFGTTIPDSVIHHYDVVIGGDEQKFPARLNNDLIRSLQNTVAPDIFTPKAVYDARKNLFSVRRLPFPGGRDKHTFDVALDNPLRPPTEGRPPKTYKITLTHVAEINPEVTARFLEGKQSHDNTVLTAIMALNVVVRMEPISRYPFNTRSFFTNRETRNIGRGIVLWRGYFQSVRPAPNKMLVNIDISTAAMHKDGPLIVVCLEKLGRPPNDVRALATRERGGTSDASTFSRLSRDIAGIRIQTLDKNDRPTGTPRVIKRLTRQGASDLEFELREGGKRTVARYFQETQGQPLKFPHVICAEVGSGALIPLEKCYIPPGQLMRKQLPPDMTKDMVEFATKKPHERLASIREGLNVLQYGQSEYVRSFGMSVDEVSGPMRIAARVLPPPSLKYGAGSKAATITPRDGAWNMRDQKFYRPVTIEQWMVVVYERQQRYNMEAVNNLIRGFGQTCDKAGIRVVNRQPEIFYNNGQLDVIADLKKCGGIVRQKSGKLPTLVVAVIPESCLDLYTAIKHFGDVQTGVATQCVRASKTFRANEQYWMNVLLKVNVKLGGINTVPVPQSVAVLTDPANPTVVMGADVIHPAPGSTDRPSFTSLVGNIDSDTAKYIASMRVQTSRQEMIDDLEDMAKEILNSYMSYRKAVEKVANAAPKRIIFYRDGVSEGQFSQVLELELPLLKSACRALNISPKITVIVVGKRHHVRMFPQEGQGDRSGNCPAGTVVDTEIAHPVEFDFYLQSHAGLLGTSRPSHYNVLYDENNFNADGLQSLSYALCHVYARATRSVSIPAPVYYADIVCSRARNHFEPSTSRRLHWTDSGDGGSETGTAASDILAEYKRLFRPPHANTAKNMYFS